MKKRLFILALAIIAIVSVFAISVSAEEADPYASYYDKVYTAIDGTPLALYEKEGETYYPLAWFYNSETGEYESFKVDVDVRFCYANTETSIAAGSDFRENANVVFTDKTKTYTMSNLILVNLQQSPINMFSGTWTSLPVEAIYCNNYLYYVNGGAFNKCSTLTVFDIPRTHAGTSGTICGAFNGTNVKELYIPQYLCLLGGAFSGCTGLEKVEFASTYTPKGWANWQTEQGKESWFFGCTNLKTVILPTDANSTHTYIGGQTFENCSSLTTVEIPSYITEIRYDAFRGCTALTTVTIPRTVTTIGGNAFTSSGVSSIIYTGAEGSDFITNVTASYPNITVTYANHCDVYYNQQHLVTNEPVKEFLGQKFLSNYKVHSKCERDCGVDTIIEELPALIVDRGFAYGPNSMLQGVAVDRELLDEYGKYFTGIKYGLVAAAKSAQASASIIDANGVGVNGYVAAVDYTERDYDLFEMNLFGISEDYQATEFYFGAYVIADGQVYYIHNGTTNNEAQAITYDDVVVIVDALVPEKEEE